MIYLFGAGGVGKKAYYHYRNEEEIVFIDNNKSGSTYLGCSVI